VISRGVTAHQSARSIARLLGRSPSTVSREMGRNGGCDRYRAALADENAWARVRSQSTDKIEFYGLMIVPIGLDRRRLPLLDLKSEI
jgi:IS30 family transposase